MAIPGYFYRSVTPLLVAQIIYVDSATGSDANGGSAGAPFATLARAWEERLKYSELRAEFKIQLVGVGPYTLPVMGASILSPAGRFRIVGDPAVEVVLASGTCTGDISGFAIPTSAGLGADTHKRKTLAITIGNSSGVRTLIALHADASITVSEKFWRSGLGVIANGDTFSIVTPGTVITVPTAASGQQVVGAKDWIGGGWTLLESPPRHTFENVSFEGTGSAKFFNAAVGFIGCKTSRGFTFNRCNVQFGGYQNGNPFGYGADSVTHKITGWGLDATAALSFYEHNSIFSVLCTSAAVTLGSAGGGGADSWISAGGRHDALVTVRASGCWQMLAPTIYHHMTAGIAVESGGFALLSAGTFVFAQTAGSCLLSKQGGRIIVSAAVVSGGTSDAAAWGSRAYSAGMILWQNQTPTLTGTAGADIHNGLTAVANATLSANGLSHVDPATFSGVLRVAA